MIDLGAWANEEYRLPATDQDESDLPDDNENPSG
jgi:endogenous inhibitor of DNA gyrase (YacG/DUF329 family)